MAHESRLQPPRPKGSVLTATISPRGNTLLAYPQSPQSKLALASATGVSNTTAAKTKRKQTVYLTSLVSRGERREFVVDTYTVFASLQKIALESQDAYQLTSMPDAPSPNQVQYYSRISQLYCEQALKQIAQIQTDDNLAAAQKASELEHHATINSVLSLAEVIYLPADGRGDGVVGEEILDWLNKVDLAPSSEEGQELASLAQPWLHPNFWPYLQRCVLRGHLRSVQALLSVVETHLSTKVQRLSKLAQDLVTSFPRSTAFRVEREFLDKLSRWKATAGEALEEAREVLEEDEEDWGEEVDISERREWEDGFLWMFELFDGREDPLLSASEDWREALAAYGIWIQPKSRRDNLPVILNNILKHHTFDQTLPSEAIEVALLRNDVALALQQSNLVSSWLVAHLADLFAKFAILPTPTLRDYFILSYADVLLEDPGMWRVVVDYLVSAGSVGRARAEQVLQSVNLDDEEAMEVAAGEKEQKMEEDGSEKENLEPEGKVRVVEEVLRVCAEHGMHEQTRSICKVFSELLVEQKRYGEAVSFCIRAGDSKRIARIADRLLDEYVSDGQEVFIKHVDSIPTSLLRPAEASNYRPDGIDDEMEPEDAPSPPHPRLSFLARYRDFFALYARGELQEAASLLVLLLTSGIAPKRFYAVMFLDVTMLIKAPELLISMEDTYDLLRCLEEVTAPISACGRDVYGHLTALGRITGSTAQDSEKATTDRAMKQLGLLRGALAAYLGRCYCA